ncbi:hypothetical protein DVB69_05910 [Sporosarcina sp. BI001-red]|uniref:hypothetical protein n=1 Tax=Sporosarcina sp. BI001-red TaxID=2282866 RepID=UPI000E2274CA|nr:hypothetical protein [Sporosarcina sp. BI001-red]REB08663.1 hypothetical protein DVB69_05910 [Sporosarcina sp. BI001-red]
MRTIERFIAEKEQILKEQPRSTAGAMKRHQTLVRVQQKIDYFDQGDLLSKKSLQKELQEIAAMQRQADELTSQIQTRKQKLLQDTFGPDATHLFK